ncbi:SRPBCC family protein [Ensifer soli]|uniref:SRPBCC family protein n=1 Tax=Ciceribacter sp. sgz301302 TaxID=3342379 RepID=UPI0035B6EFDD
MTDAMTLARPAAYGVLTEPATLRIERRLPGPVERVWAYLTDGELRRRWLASGDMPLEPGASFVLTWRNDDLTDPPGARPPGFGESHGMTCRVLAVEAPVRLVITWGSASEVAFDLAASDGEVVLTITHRRVPDRGVLLNVSSGWHAPLDVLAARLSETEPVPFWDRWTGLRAEYEQRFPA